LENIAFKRACNLSTNHELSTISHIWFEDYCFGSDNFKGLYEIKAESQGGIAWKNIYVPKGSFSELCLDTNARTNFFSLSSFRT
jgi:hypothetical protein